jgi:hypothetical protein
MLSLSLTSSARESILVTVDAVELHLLNLMEARGPKRCVSKISISELSTLGKESITKTTDLLLELQRESLKMSHLMIFIRVKLRKVL